MVLCLHFQSDVPRVETAVNRIRMATLCKLTRTTRWKIMAILFLLSALLNSSESLADLSRRNEDNWQKEADYTQRITTNVPSSSSPPQIDSAERYVLQRDMSSRLSHSRTGSAELAHSPASASSLVQRSPDFLQRRSLETVSPTPASTISLVSGPGPAPAPASAPMDFMCGICGWSYTAGIGETLSSVAAYCNVPLDEVRRLNIALNSSSIEGQAVKIPCTGTGTVNCTYCGHEAIIKQGNTLDLLAKGCNLTLQMVETVNPGIDYSNIFPEQYITLPCANNTIVEKIEGCGVCGRGFTAEGNELITDIAMRCGVSVGKLLEVNPAVNSTTRLMQRQFLRVPCSGNDPANCGPCGNTFRNAERDPLQVIAAKCRVGYIELTNANQGTDLMQGDENLVTIPCNSIPPAVVCSPCSPNFFTTDPVDISSVATTCNVSTELIAYANNLPLSGPVSAGRNLSIPCADLPVRNVRECGHCGSSFTLASQVTLGEIAGACESTVAAIRAENGNLTLDLLGPKDHIFLPCNMSQVDCGPCGFGYKTTDSDTLQSVAVKCATPAAEIVYANRQYNFSQPLTADQSLFIPCGPAGSSSSSAWVVQALACSRQMLHVLIVLTALNTRSIWYCL